MAVAAVAVAMPTAAPSSPRRGHRRGDRRAVADRTGARRDPGVGVADRRVFLLRSVGVASLAAITGGTGRLLQRRYDVGGERAALALPSVADRRPAAVLPPNADLDVEGLSAFVTPNADFYRIDTALVVPQVSKDDWRLRIHGMVEQRAGVDVRRPPRPATRSRPT